MNRRLLAFSGTCLILGGIARPAHADGANAELSATALFDEGRRLMAQKRYGEACPKLAESERLAPSGGTLINLAACYEHTGQTASAWLTWKNVAARANAADKADVEKSALAHAASLEPSLAKLTIAVDPASDVAGLEIRRDGVIVGRAERGLAIPVDPGPHTVEATAPRRTPWSQSVDVAPKQPDARVLVHLAPRDEPATAAAAVGTPSASADVAVAPALAAETAADGSMGVRRTLGWVGIGLGTAGIVTGVVFALVAGAKEKTATDTDHCLANTCPTRAGLADTNAAIEAAHASTYAFIGGGVLAAAGVVLLVTAPSGKSVQVAPTAGPRTAGLSLATSW